MRPILHVNAFHPHFTTPTPRAAHVDTYLSPHTPSPSRTFSTSPVPPPSSLTQQDMLPGDTCYFSSLPRPPPLAPLSPAYPRRIIYNINQRCITFSISDVQGKDLHMSKPITQRVMERTCLTLAVLSVLSGAFVNCDEQPLPEQVCPLKFVGYYIIVCWLIGCLTSPLHASISQEWIFLKILLVLPHWYRSFRSNLLPHAVALLVREPEGPTVHPPPPPPSPRNLPLLSQNVP